MEKIEAIHELQLMLKRAKDCLDHLAVTIAWAESIAASLPNEQGQLNFDFGVCGLAEVELGLRM